MLLTKSELADQCKVSLTTINTWIKEGILGYLKIKGRILFEKEAVLEDLRKYHTREEPQLQEQKSAHE